MKTRSIFLVLAVAMATILFAAVAVAQTPNAMVSGSVMDPTGAVIPGATVTVTNQATNVVSRSTTNNAGAFTVLNLMPGRYVVSVTKTGFKTVQLPPVELQVNQNLNEKITLPVGNTSEAVEVSASSVGAMIQSVTTELGTTIDTQQIEQLPLNGRNFTQLLILQPGVNPVDTSQGNSNGNTGAGGGPDGGNISIPGSVVFKPSVNGAGNRSNAWYMDGIINTDDRGGAWAVPPIADSIQEFKVQSHNNDAQYGNVLGAVVNIVTKSGTNQFHGSAWEYARNHVFDARNPFTDFCTPATCASLANSLTQQVSSGSITASAAGKILSGTPAPPADFSQNEFGGSLGGPIRKDKTFFYVAYEGWRYTQNSQSFVKVPTPEELAGDFTGSVTPELIGSVNAVAGTITPAQIFNPFAESTANLSVPFYCDGAGNPMPLANPGAAFGQAGYGVQVAGGTGCNRIPAGLIDQKLAKVISAYTGPVLKNCAFTPNYTFAVDNCLDTRPRTNNADNFDFRIDQHFGTKDTVFGRAYMMWGSNTSIVAGTSSVNPNPYHTWNIGGAWDHVFGPSLIMEIRGGFNVRPVLVNPTNSLGYKPETDAGFNNLDATAGYFLNIAGYIGSANSGIGNVGPQQRENPEHDINGALTWIHGRHTLKFGAEYLYETRLEINKYETFVSSTSQTCPVAKTGLFTCGSNQGNALASMLLDLPSALTVNVPQYEEVHAKIAPIGGFIQDEWHVTPTLTVNLGLRYDYDPAVTLLTSNGEPINALDLPHQKYIIGAAPTAAYTTGCATPQQPPCVPGGLNASNPAFNVTVGGVAYNTLNNIVFSPSQPSLKKITDNIGPRIGIAWQFMPNTVLRMGYGIFYDPISYRSQYAENTLQGSIWPWTRGVSDTLNNAAAGTAPAPTVNPICTSAATCGPYGGYATSQLTGLAGSNPIVVAPTPWGSTFGGYTNDPSYTDPRSQQWNLQIQRELTPSSMISLAYVGSKTQRLEWCCKANYPQGGPFCQNNANAGFTCPATPLSKNQINQLQYMPFAAQGWNYSTSTGYSNFNALEAQFQKRFSAGLQTLIAFTWEKCLGDSNGDFNAENGKEGNPYEYYFNQRLSKGVCAFDIPKVFNWSAVYELPFGKDKRWLQSGPLAWIAGNWQTSFSFLKRSGEAYNPTWGGASNICASTTATGCVPFSVAGVAPTSNDPANLSNAGCNITGYSRPSLVPGCNVTAGQSANQWFNPACFISPSSTLVGPGYGFGNSGVGALRTMGYWNVDFALAKNIPIGETKRIQVRAEAFNIFNHMVLAAPAAGISPSYQSGAVSYGTAGIVSAIANNPRQLQLAARFTF
ncbi:MAG: TonB-dependent receptor domain-containing protein [Terriglobales bacterium]